MKRPNVKIDEEEREETDVFEEERPEHAHRFTDPILACRRWLHRTFPGHEHAVLCGLAGLLACILFFAIGFWRTVLLALCVFVGVALGQMLDGDPKIVNFMRALLRNRDER